ncbi:hypothetical protein [Pseudomonas chlororaphis]|uniref:hypothetical protein n=1 Tax=Pseudomonas chlororaphis TaxID=587753 RepID=UPI00406CEC08
MLKNALLLAAIAVSLPAHAAQPENAVLGWTLIHNGEQVDGQSYITIVLGGRPYAYRNLVPIPYNESTVHSDKKVQVLRGKVTTGVELSFKPNWQNGVAVDYNIRQLHLNGFTRLPGDLPIDRPDQRTYEARGTSRPLAVGETELIRLTCDTDIPVEQCPYHVELKVIQVN